MSELTPCNYCTMQRIKGEAKSKNEIVITKKGTGVLGGIDVYVLPKGETPKKKYFRAWFMALGKYCEC